MYLHHTLYTNYTKNIDYNTGDKGILLPAISFMLSLSQVIISRLVFQVCLSFLDDQTAFSFQKSLQTWYSHFWCIVREIRRWICPQWWWYFLQHMYMVQTDLCFYYFLLLSIPTLLWIFFLFPLPFLLKIFFLYALMQILCNICISISMSYGLKLLMSFICMSSCWWTIDLGSGNRKSIVHQQLFFVSSHR